MTEVSRGRLTTHVLDTARGRPAAGLAFALYRMDGDSRRRILEGQTNTDGRLDGGALLEGPALTPGPYELVFAAGAYQAGLGGGQPDGFYDMVPIRFVIVDPDSHYHIPLILSPFGYSTYRGS